MEEAKGEVFPLQQSYDDLVTVCYLVPQAKYDKRRNLCDGSSGIERFWWGQDPLGNTGVIVCSCLGPKVLGETTHLCKYINCFLNNTFPLYLHFCEMQIF